MGAWNMPDIITGKHDYSLDITLHGLRVAQIARDIGMVMMLPQEDIYRLYDLGLLHDIGKSKVPPDILYKKDKLTEEEWEVMKKHPIYSEDIYLMIENNKTNGKIIRCHHEYYDGSGYPDGLSGERIPLLSRIITIADIFEAITSARIYRPHPVRDPFRVMEYERGRKIDKYIYDNYAKHVLSQYFLIQLG
ncbi:MAG: HD domain-containing protein [Thermosipho sp. (in: Bacteria)]|nr:HD domain-containing protein [Thermosipho sp. (in: thermotogales)]